MAARHVVLVATGRGKAEAVHHLVEGAVSAMWPATILQHHPHVTVLLDGAAASRLQLVDYYRETYRSKPRGRASECLLTPPTPCSPAESCCGRAGLRYRTGAVRAVGAGRSAAARGPRPRRRHGGAGVRRHPRARRRRRELLRRRCRRKRPPRRPCTAGHGTTTVVASLVTAGPAELLRQVAALAERGAGRRDRGHPPGRSLDLHQTVRRPRCRR